MKTSRDVTVERIGSSTVFIGSTPRGILRQHFREISDQLGFSSEIDLAKAVVANSVTERWEMLKRFYVDKNAVLSGLSCFTAGSETIGVAADHERQDLKRAQRSLEQNHADESHEVAKKSKKNLKPPPKKHYGCLKTHSKKWSPMFTIFAVLSLAWCPTYEVNQPFHAFFESTNVLLCFFLSERRR